MPRFLSTPFVARTLAAALALLAPAAALHADVIHVKEQAEGGDGTTWDLAFTDLQAALAVAQTGDEIWIAAGTYTPSDFDATASFVVGPGVALYGGFAGGETSREQRDWEENRAILSGDVGRDDVVNPWPSGWLITTANCGHVIDASGATRETVIDGLVIANGNTGPAGTPAGSPLMFGGGVYAVGGSPTIRHCTFEHNLAAFGMGGGIYCLDGDPLIESCTFRENYVHGGGGGGMLIAGDATPEIRDCTFRDNVSVAISASNLDGDGAGLAVYATNEVTVERCRFEGNTARAFYAIGDELGYGGGLWVWNGGVVVRECVFIDNTAHYGGGMIVWGPATVVNSLFVDNTALPHANDPYPELGGDGAGIAAYNASADVVDVVNCTIAFNHGKKYVGAVGLWNAVLNLGNCIVRENAGTHPETTGTWKEQVAGFADIDSCNIAHIFEPHGKGEDPIDPENLPGVIDVDPAWVSPGPAGDLRLAAGSPCIDAANNGLLPEGVNVDLDGAARFVDDPDVTDTGVGPGPIADIGAFERQIACATDLDGNGETGFSDLVALLADWGPCPGCAADLDGDGAIGFGDLLMLLAAWGSCG